MRRSGGGGGGIPGARRGGRVGARTPVAGFVAIFGKPSRDQRRLVGYVPQRNSVDWDFPTSVLDVVMMGRYGVLGWLRRAGRAERDLAMEPLGNGGVAGLGGRHTSPAPGGGR